MALANMAATTRPTTLQEHTKVGTFKGEDFLMDFGLFTGGEVQHLLRTLFMLSNNS